MDKRFVLLGKSSFAIAIIVDILKLRHGINKLSIVSNIADEENDSLKFDYKIAGVNYVELSQNEFTPSKEDKYIIASIGKSRYKIFQFFKEKYSLLEEDFIEVIHPNSVIGSNVNYGVGFHLSPLSVIAPFTTIGDFVVINRNVSIGHHNTIENFVTINPGVNIAGCCTIKEGSIIGAGATILDKVTIGKNSIIGAGSIVTKDIPDGVVAYGSPAKIVREIN